MADRYWVGTSGTGTGTWNTTSTAVWSATQGGAGGASVPTANDDVYFWGPTGTITLTGAIRCRSLNVYSSGCTFNAGTSPTLVISGGLYLETGTTWNSTAVVTFNGAGSWTIETWDQTWPNGSVTFSNASGTWTFVRDFRIPSTAVMTLSAGTLDLQATVRVGRFATSGTPARRVNGVSSYGFFILTSATTSTIWDSGTNTSQFSTNGDLVVKCQNSGATTKTITVGNMSEANSISFELTATAGTFSLGTSVFRNLYINGTQTISNSAITIYGNYTRLSDAGTTTMSGGTSSWTFAASSGTKTIVAYDQAHDFPMTIGTSGTTATWEISNGLRLGSTRQLTLSFGTLTVYGSIIAAGVTLTNASNSTLLSGFNDWASWPLPALTQSAGTLTLNTNFVITGAYTLTAGRLVLNGYSLQASSFVSSNTNARGVDFGTSSIQIVTATAGTIWNTGTITNFTITGTPTVNCYGDGAVNKVINTGSPSEANAISFRLLDGSGPNYSWTTGIIRDLYVDGGLTVNNNSTLTIYGTFTHVNGTFAAGANAWTFAATSGNIALTVRSDTTYDIPMTFGTAGTTASWTLNTSLTLGAARPFTLTAGTVILGGTLTVGNFVSNNSNARTLNFGTNKIVVYPNATSTAYNTATLSGLTLSGTGRLLVECSGSVNVTKTITPGASDEANSIDFSIISGGGTWGFTAGSTVRNLVINGTQTIQNNAITIYGNYTHSTSNGTTTFTAGTNAWTFASTAASQNITAGAVTHTFPWIINSATSTVYYLQSALTISSDKKFTMTNGKVDLNGFTLTTGQFDNTGGNQEMIFDGGTLAISGTGIVVPYPFNLSDNGAIVFTPGTGTATISMVGASTKLFNGNGYNFTGVTLNQGSGTILRVLGSNTFENLTSTISASAAGPIQFEPGSTTTFVRFTLTGLGSAANRPQVATSTAGSYATIYREPNQAGFVFGASNIIATDINFTPYATNDFIRWYIGSNSTVNNSTGVLVQDYVLGTSPKVYLLTSGSSWIVPADFNHTTNTVYLFGAGGNGDIGGNGGAGGGGGGYSRGDNINLRDFYEVACYIPGGGDSTACSFHTLSAGSASGRFGGTGTHANGGNGGASAWGTVGTPIIGGSGGGGGGPWGNGANGTNGTVVTINTNRAGHGGAGAAGGVAGSTGSGTSGGNGGSASANAGTGTQGLGGSNSVSATPGYRGGGGGGSGARPPGVNFFVDYGGAGGNGIDILSSLGAGGGGGSGGTTNDANYNGMGSGGGSGGRFGGGGGGGGFGGSYGFAGSSGGPGAVIIVYVPVPVNKFFNIFVP